MLLALIFMHKNSITHRDLKSANVMMTIERDIKLIDLGLCAILEGGYKVGMVGSPFWMAPEMIRREPYDNKIDIWSFAICLLELANRHPPNDSNIIRAMFTTAVEGCPQPFDQPRYWSPLFKSFVSKCLEFDNSKRSNVQDLLKDPFLDKAISRRKMKKILTSAFLEETYNILNIT